MSYMQSIKCLYNFFPDFLISRGVSPDFEQMSDEDLALHLRSMYASIRQKPKPGQEEGEMYSRLAYRNLWAGLQHHLISPPHNRTLNLISNKVFMGGNQMYDGMLKKLKKEGRDVM